MKAFSKWTRCALIIFLMLGLPTAGNASCNSPKQGPPGPQGLQGLPGPIFSNYASAYTLGVQVPTESPYNILFTSQQLPSVGITHPVGIDFTQFQVQNTGVYMIAWTMTLGKFDTGTVSVNLFNTTANTPIQPSPFSSQSFEIDLFGTFETVSGQTIIPLTAGTSIQLQLQITSGTVELTNPSFTITQISI